MFFFFACYAVWMHSIAIIDELLSYSRKQRHPLLMSDM
jgi:hypothetical protein